MTATITIRPLQRAELTTLWQLGFSDPNASGRAGMDRIFMTNYRLKQTLRQLLAPVIG